MRPYSYVVSSTVVTVPPKAVCPGCRASEVSLVNLKGTGKLAAYTVVYVAPPMMVEEGFNPKNPYCSGIVELQEGPKITARNGYRVGVSVIRLLQLVGNPQP